MKPALGVHLVLCVHCVCNQVGGTIHGLLGDGTDKMSVHVSSDRNACVAEQLAHHGDVIPEASISDAAQCRRPWKLIACSSPAPALRSLWNSHVT